MTIVAAPGATIYPAVDWGVSGLTGTIGVRIYQDSDGSTVLARATAGIAERPATSGNYVATLVAPTTAGEYTIMWDNGAVTVGNTSVEDLTVSYSAAAASVPLATDLCTVADVRSYLQKAASETTQDTIIQTLISQASPQIEKLCSRDFAPRTAATRTFGVDGLYVDLNPFDLRTATTVTLDPNGSATVITAYKLEPIGSSVLGTYTGLRLTRTTNLSSTTWVNYGYGELSILGNWGPATVPPDVTRACVVTVALWIRREIAARGSANPDFEVDGFDQRPRAIPGAALGILEPYMRMSVA